MVASEILMASESGCPIEMHKIEIDKCDEMYDRDCKGGRKMPFHRAIYDSATGQSPNLPREQVSNIVLKKGGNKRDENEDYMVIPSDIFFLAATFVILIP